MTDFKNAAKDIITIVRKFEMTMCESTEEELVNRVEQHLNKAYEKGRIDVSKAILDIMERS